MASSLRSRACREGRWRDQPRRRRNISQVWLVPYRTPVADPITSATRFSEERNEDADGERQLVEAHECAAQLGRRCLADEQGHDLGRRSHGKPDDEAHRDQHLEARRESRGQHAEDEDDRGGEQGRPPPDPVGDPACTECPDDRAYEQQAHDQLLVE
jgi:hypothetical protein